MNALGTSRLSGIYPGWWVAIASCLSLGMVAGATFWTFGLFVDPLVTEFAWSRSVLGLAASLSLLISGLASPLVGRLVTRYQPRRVMLIGSVATAAGYLLLAHTQTLWQFLVLIAVLAFFRTWIFYVPITTLITRWFTRRRATAMGIATSGFGLGGLVFLPLMASILSAVGWRETFVIMAVLVLAINGMFLTLAGNDPPKAWAGHEAIQESRTGPASVDGIIRVERVQGIFRAPVFWIVAGSFGLFFFAQWAFLYHAPQLLVHGGLTSRDAALVLGASGGLGVLVRLTSGPMLDRIVRLEYLAAAVFGIMALALIVLATGASILILAAFIVLWGIGSGIGPALEPMLVSRLFGRKHYGLVYGAVDGVDTVVATPGPWLGAVAFDVSGSYLSVILLYAIACIVGSVSFGLLPRLLHRGANSEVRRGSPSTPPVPARSSPVAAAAVV